MSLRARLKSLPLAAYLARKLRALPGQFRSRQAVFTRIYRRKAWGGAGSVSGPGSDLEQTRVVRAALPRIMRACGVRTLLDASCGDFCWMSRIELPVERYIGVDIVAELIAENQRRYGDAVRTFVRADVAADALPAADLILCRDCVMHLGYGEIFQALKNFQATGATWLLITTYAATPRNADIGRGGWWPMNLERPPFGFPPPLELVDEESPDAEGRRWGKSLGLWKLQELALGRG